MAESSPKDNAGNTAIAGKLSQSARKPDPLVGTVLAERYRILEVIGRGGMGVVYKARHEFMDRFVALKMLLPQLGLDELSIERFKREAQAASRISHPNIIGLYDFGLADGLPYLVMDYLEGCSLGDIIKRDGQLSVQRTIIIFLQICEALEHAHKQGVIHRDLKPRNIMLIGHDDNAGFVKVVDFGIAKMYEADGQESQQLTQTGELFGSPVYMSPEQCRGEKADQRSDIYSIGCVLYETLTGKLPLVGKNAIETVAKHLHTIPQPFSDARPDLYIPDWLESIVFKAMQKDPNQRHQNMLELHDELVLGFTSNCSSTQLQALPTRVISASVSAIKTRTADMNRPGATGSQIRASQTRPKSPSLAILWTAIASIVLVALMAIIFSFVSKHQVETVREVSVKQTNKMPVKNKLENAAAVQTTSNAEDTNTTLENIVENQAKGTTPVSIKPRIVTTPVSNKNPRRSNVKKTRAVTEHAKSLPIANLGSADSGKQRAHRKRHHTDGNNIFYEFSTRENNFGDPKSLPGN